MLNMFVKFGLVCSAFEQGIHMGQFAGSAFSYNCGSTWVHVATLLER